MRPPSEELAQRAISVLNESERILSRYVPDMVLSRGYKAGTGGTAADVVDHIHDIRRREWTPDMMRSFSNAVVSPDYLPDGVIAKAKNKNFVATIWQVMSRHPKVA